MREAIFAAPRRTMWHVEEEGECRREDVAPPLYGGRVPPLALDVDAKGPEERRPAGETAADGFDVAPPLLMFFGTEDGRRRWCARDRGGGGVSSYGRLGVGCGGWGRFKNRGAKRKGT
ncbi:hypothetical protein SEVIR_4G262350v4 [Setaria viridis]